MILASSLDLGKSDVLVNLAHDLAAFVRQAVQEGSSFDDIERGCSAECWPWGMPRSTSS